MSVKISYGTGNSVEKTIGTAPGNITPGTTFGELINKTRSALGHGNNVEIFVGGLPQPDSVVAQDGMDCKIYDKACSKQLS